MDVSIRILLDFGMLGHGMGPSKTFRLDLSYGPFSTLLLGYYPMVPITISLRIRR